MMRDTLIIGGMILAALAIGAVLFFYGTGAKRYGLPQVGGGVSFQVIKQGTDALSMTDRVNYKIENQDQFNELWNDIQTKSNSAPGVDFTQDDVLAVFDGTHTTGGYEIAVTKIEDTATARIVHVQRTMPGERCVVSQQITAPYQVIAVPKSPLPLSHIDETVTKDCK